jgi:hypothetical protein
MINSTIKCIGKQCNIYEAGKAILTMAYYKNEAAASGAVHNFARHEDALADVLRKDGGFTKWIPPRKLTTKQVHLWRENPPSATIFPIGTFIEQPLGTHKSPDFIIKPNSEHLLFLECKSSETSCFPMYNSGSVHLDYLYVFCSKKTNETTIYKGDSIINVEQQRLINEHIEDARKRDEILNQQLRSLDNNHRGLTYYTRPMINQSGGREYTNYFTHKDRLQAEQIALEWIKKMTYSDDEIQVPRV